jgi:hypothetical protein
MGFVEPGGRVDARSLPLLENGVALPRLAPAMEVREIHVDARALPLLENGGDAECAGALLRNSGNLVIAAIH